ncbi:cell division protein SepF [Mobilicoccus pelagius]|uniref:Cell division protein SepF n=1 Tax=Mobilicoccus pelagius NBRC 104925 TaxID=1089455 RepID=H5UQF8_9MICO|nr:cell division protein SepF [Mobilicoccus pelagius]GAB47966.1 cell division protein SepF [Mobilicoccus pelagius NBRC 104925]
MAGALRKAWVYLGLADEDDRDVRYEDEYEDREVHMRRHEDERDDDRVDAEPVRAERSERVESREPVREVLPQERRPLVREGEGEDAGSVVPVARERRGSSVALAPVEERRTAEVTPFPRRTPVSEVVKDVDVTGVHRICTIHPRTYNEAKKIGETFREGTPIIMNLSDLDDADAKRLVDFAAGLVFGLQGAIERVTNKVFLLSPVNLEVTTGEGEGSRARRSVFNQS